MLQKTAAAVESEGAQCVLFFLGDEEYGVPAIQVQEIVRQTDITWIPSMPNYVKGICNLRGTIAPIVDLKSRFGITKGGEASRARVIVAKLENELIGFAVDAVNGVRRIPDERVQAMAGGSGVKIEAEYVMHIAKFGDRLIHLLDLERLLSKLSRDFIRS